MIAGVLADVPIVPGRDAATSGFSRYLRDKIRAETGSDLRGDVHGVDVFSDSDRPVYMRMEADGFASVPVDRFLEALGTAATDYRAAVGRPQRLLAAEVLMSAAFEASDRARFLAHITALEILADREPRSALLAQVVDGLPRNLDAVKGDLTEGEYQSFRSSLATLRLQSIGQAVRRLGTDIDRSSIPGLGDEDPGDFLARCYQARSNLVHEGETSADLRALGGPLHFLIRAIFLREMVDAD